MNDWKDRIENIKDNLYSGGGQGQAVSLLDIMLNSYGSKNFNYSDIDPKDVLNIIGKQIDSLRRIVSDGGLVSIDTFEIVFRTQIKGESYVCLDKNLKFCVKQYATENWVDIKYVFPYMNVSKAFDIIEDYENN